MIETLIQLGMEYGAFPGLVVYLVYTIVKDYKLEIKKINEKLDQHSEKVLDNLDEQNKSINELIHVMDKLQNTIANQFNSLIVLFVSKGNKDGDK